MLVNDFLIKEPYADNNIKELVSGIGKGSGYRLKLKKKKKSPDCLLLVCLAKTETEYLNVTIRVS